MIEESPGRGFGVFNVEFTVLGPNLCVGAGHDFAFEGEFVGGEGIDGCEADA